MKKQASVATLPQSPRERILRAAMEAFMELGYSDASTLEIATRAQVSKRELYALFGSKQAMLAACIADRVGRMQLPTELPAPRDRRELVDMLAKLGATVLREVSDPGVMAVFRLAINEAQRAPEVAATLETARRLMRTTAQNIVAQAQSAGLIGAGDPSEIAARYLALLWGDLMVSILLRVREAPSSSEIARRVTQAGEDFLRLYPEPKKSPRHAARRGGSS
ncbi:MAG TPA: TetR/AcrR family transcriptional regulator [Polyangiaceae bacterium]|nr:TetR/AcrR family transcriptional regulator [Polyangiaceae bacterium]